MTPFQICFTQMVTLGLWATSVEMYAKRFGLDSYVPIEDEEDDDRPGEAPG